MKRHGNLFDEICDIDNLRNAFESAKVGKRHYAEVKMIERRPNKYLRKLQTKLLSGEYKTSQYTVFERWEGGKLRTIQSLPFYPDRIVHHAVMNICGDFWRKSLIRDTFQSLPERGTHDLRKRVQNHLKEHSPRYYLQIDIKKFYPSTQHWVVEKYAIDKFVKCPRTNSLLKEMLHSIDGLPIGSFLSQIWGNLVLSPVDWYVKQDLGVKGYFRYCDDLVLFGDSKEDLLAHLQAIESKINNLSLTVKPDWLLHSTEDNSLDFCGYKFKLCGTRVRDNMKKRFKVSVKENRVDSVASYWGWFKPLKDTHLYDIARGIR